MAFCIYLLSHSLAFHSIGSLPYRCILPAIGYVKPCKKTILLGSQTSYYLCHVSGHFVLRQKLL